MVKQLFQFVKQHRLALLFAFCILVGSGITFFAANTFELDHTRIISNTPDHFASGWSVNESGQLTELDSFLTCGVFTFSGSKTIEIKYPADASTGELCLYFRSKNLKFRVFADDQLLFSYGWNSTTRFGKSFGSLENLVDLPTGSASTLRLQLTTQNPDVAGIIFAPQLGTRDSVILSLFQQKGLCIIVCVLLLLIAAVLLIFSAFQFFRHMAFETILYLGCGVLFIGVWLSTETLLPQFLFESKVISYLLANLSFLLLPVPFLLFLNQICPNYSKLLSAAGIFQCAYALARLLLYVTNVMDFDNLEILSHLPLLANLLVGVVVCFRERHHPSAKNALIATCVLCVSSLFSVSKYWWGSSDYTDFVFSGILLFILILVGGVSQRAFAIQKEAVRAEFYKRCAYTDLMTELGNRASFERHLESLKHEPSSRVTLFLFDLNNLKETNDSLGHSEGDRLIGRLAGCLHAAFDDAARNYRIGGDEFVTIFTGNRPQEIDECLNRFYAAVNKTNQSDDVTVSVAMGRACNKEEGFYGSIEDLVKLADTRMYLDKQAERATTPRLS